MTLTPRLQRLMRRLAERRQQGTRALFGQLERSGSSPGRVVNCMTDEYDVYIGRPSRWGNPFKLSKSKHRAAALEAYREWLRAQPELLEDASRELLGKTLGCWCAPYNVCHGHVLLEEALAHAKRKQQE